ncbi:hypothetical protein [Halostagnicola kamekurae]|uniref:Restriction endonuclease n=1 Tax=Halostagnicola kamekurae TaxID=619731 RepID=A0A1I6V7H9_9EURY|nr:hypothetical protein [Halostagnicola kamekurae]SFT09580.1 hypothetical protein SAMN04488556_0099 [Halostagnicola kamekurae]
MSVQELNTVISKLKERDFEREEELRSLLPEFVEALEYDSENLFFEMSIEIESIPEPSEPVPSPTVDAVIKSNSRSPPWMVISVQLMYEPVRFPGHRGEMARIEEERLRTIYENTPVEQAIIFSNELITYISEGDFSGISINDWTGSSKTLYESLKAPDSLPHQESISTEEEHKGTVESTHFEIDLDEYQTTLNKVENAESSPEKGEALEELSTLLFNSISFMNVRRRNLRNSSSELDVIVENNQSDNNPLKNYDRFILIESKNWKKPVGASYVRDFISKIRSIQVDLGVIVAPEGITGKRVKTQ